MDTINILLSDHLLKSIVKDLLLLKRGEKYRIETVTTRIIIRSEVRDNLAAMRDVYEWLERRCT